MHGEISRLWSDLNGAPARKDLQSMLSVGPIAQTVHNLLAAFLSDHNYVAGRDIPGYSKLCIRFLETLIRARQIVEDRNAGRPPNTEGIAPLALTFKANVGSHGLTIEGLHGIWAARETGTPKTTDEFLSIIREFQAFVVGQYRTDQAANVKKEHVIAYRNHLTKKGLKDKTITKKISTIKTLFTTAIEDSMLAPSEVQSVKVGKPKKRGKGATKARLSFEIVELEKIFSPAIYLKTPGAIKGSRTEYWAPLVSLFGGFRIEEVCQLRVSDVREHLGQPFFFIIDGEDQELKNENARRNVPVHEELIRCGFLDFVEAGRKAGNEWLFSELEAEGFSQLSAFIQTRRSPVWDRGAG